MLEPGERGDFISCLSAVWITASSCW